jgi:microcystin-dependent protein
MDGTPLPSALSGNTVLRLIEIDQALLYLVTGALDYLVLKEPLEQTGTLTVETAKNDLSVMLETYLNEEVSMTPVGATMIWHEQIPPDRWLVCDGSAVSTTDYPELFALWAYKYGGAGAQFGLPDMRNYSPMGVGGNVLLDATAGTVSETLTVNEIPSHKHDQFIGPTTPAYAGTGGAGRIAYGVLGTASLVPIQTANNGGGLAHNNLSPVFGVNFIVYGGRAP